MRIQFTWNGDPVEVALKTGDPLLANALRDGFRLTGAKLGCGISACGICIVTLKLGSQKTNCKTFLTADKHR